MAFQTMTYYKDNDVYVYNDEGDDRDFKIYVR